MPEEEEEEQEIEYLFEHIMKENFPNLAKETESPGSPGSSKKRVPKKLEPRKHTVRHIIITLPKVKGKERILKEAREKETVIPTKEFP